MFIVSLFGGLASQMNQYAFSRFLLRQYPGSCVKIFDATCRSPGDKHCGYELERIFGIRSDEINPRLVNKLSGRCFGDGIFSRLMDYMKCAKNMYFGSSAEVITEQDPTTPSERMYSLDSEKDNFFWSNYATDYYETPELIVDVAKCFQFPVLPSRAKAIADQIKSTDSVSIHVRRGDYSAWGFPLLGEDYYKKAIELIQEKTSADLHYFVFSDDIDAAKQTLSFLKGRVTFVDDFRGYDSYLDMQLMTICHHNINANSGFSYWGAWLNPHVDKIVVGPSVHVPSCKSPVTSKGWYLV